MNRSFCTASLRVAAVIALGVLLNGLAAPLLYAQEEAETDSVTPIATPSRVAPEVDEITVTGTQNSVTNVQDEAQAITAFAMEDLDRANIVNVDKLAFNVPGLHVGRLGNRVIVTLRGIGTENSAPTGEPGVAYMVDGVNYARPGSAQVSFFDLEGVQVLRGPQGTKGGKNTTSGWINVQSRKPHGDFEVQGDLQVGAYNQRMYRAAVNIPINEYVQLRSATFFEDRDGYLNNIFFPGDDRDAFDADDFGLRQHIRVLPTESLDLLFSYNYYRQDGNGTQPKLLPLPLRNECDAPFTHPSRLPTGVACFPADNIFPPERIPADESTVLSKSTINADGLARRSNRFWGATQTMTWDVPDLPGFGATQLKGIFSYQESQTKQLRDFDTTDVPKNNNFFQDESASQHSAELQWTGGLGERLEWQTGLWFLRETTEYDLELPIRATLVDDSVVRGRQDTEAQSYAAMIDADFHLSETLTLGLGARYTRDTRRVQQIAPFRGRGTPDVTTCERGEQDTFEDLIPDSGPQVDRTTTPFTVFAVPVPVPTCKQTFRHTTGGLRLEWRPNEAHLLYARTDRGYKAGGYASMAFGTYDPEFIWSYQLGSKSSFFNERLVLNFEAFLSDYDDLQLVVVDSISVRTDTADATIFGFDLEMEAEPAPGFRIDGKLGYLNAELTEYFAIDPTNTAKSLDNENCRLNAIPGNPLCPIAPDDFGGNDASRSPKWTFSMGVEYDFLSRWGTLTPRVQYYWQDETFYSGFNRPIDLQEKYHFTNVKLTWRSPDERYKVEAFVDNLEDDRVFQNLVVGPAVLGSPLLAWYGNPRVWGIRAGFTY